MEGLYHGYAIGNDAFFANTEAEALAEFGKRVGCEVRKCVYPVRCERVYCISEHGDMFGLIEDKSKHVFIGYSSKRQVLHKNSKKPTSGVWYGVKHYLTGKDTVMRAERLVYCTFVLGEWREDVKVQFKDGDPYNVCVVNLEEPQETYSPIWAEHMTEQTKVYEREFNRVVGYVRWYCGIRDEEAQDVVQDTFMWLTSSERTMPSYFIGAWMFWSKFNGMHIVRDRIRMCAMEGWYGWRNDRPIDIDILGLIKNEKHRDMLQMRLHGYAEKEIAEKYHTTQGTVRVTMQRVVANLRAAFIKDFNVLGIKPPEGRRGNIFI
jgi:hypothetical protein